jgi:threonyl-tRNA synthetase
MFLVLDNESGEHEFGLKPMNCPSHHIYFASKTHSYRELPVRFTTYDVLHRNEVSGSLSGMTRVRQFQQDDCHVYLREDQIEAEVRRLTAFILDYYTLFGLTSTIKFATRPPTRIGDDPMWDRAEDGLRKALEATGLPYEVKPGDGAFYGPKIDFDVADSLGRKWQLGTIQLDYAAPERFNLEYVGEDNAPHRPVVIHRAVMGSFERFTAILIEHYAGAFPLWLAPEQIRVLPITDRINGYAESVRQRLADAGLRVRLDDRSEKSARRSAMRSCSRSHSCSFSATARRRPEPSPYGRDAAETRAPVRSTPSWPAPSNSTPPRAPMYRSPRKRRCHAEAEDTPGRCEALQEDRIGQDQALEGLQEPHLDQEDHQAEARAWTCLRSSRRPTRSACEAMLPYNQ